MYYEFGHHTDYSRAGVPVNIETTVPSEFRTELGYLGQQDVHRVMACLVGLGSEVFMLKAEVERLRRALLSSGLTQEQLDAAGKSEIFEAWLAKERDEFARVLLDPLWRATAPVKVDS
jgi:hypothetical protein